MLLAILTAQHLHFIGDNFGGVTIDRYADFVVFSWYNTFVYQYRDIIVKAFQKVYPASQRQTRESPLR